ncbi:unnamed protein product [Gadus morhua 'NCC']
MQKKESQIQIGWVEGSQEEGTKNIFWRPAILEACNGEDLQVAGIGEDEGEVDGGPLLEGLEGLEGGTPLEGKVEGGPLLEGLEGGTPLEVKVEGGPLLEGLEGGTPLEVKVGFRNRTGLGDRSQLRGWREM